MYLGILASTILFIGANAGVIGASRITYAMSGYRQLPLVFRKIHPHFKTPWLALVFFAGTIPILLTLTGQTKFLGGDLLVRRDVLVHRRPCLGDPARMRARDGDEIAYKARGNFRWRGVDWPLFAIVGGLGTGLSWLVIVITTPSIRYTGIAWLVLGFGFYVLYRRRVVHAPLGETVRAPVEFGPAAVLEFRSILVPIAPGYASDEAMDFACRLAAERRASIMAFTAIDIPLDLPLDAELPADVREANRQLDEARAIGELVRGDRHGPHRAHPEHRPRHRRRGGAAPLGDHRHGRPTARPAPARATYRSSATRSTSSCGTRRAA